MGLRRNQNFKRDPDMNWKRHRGPFKVTQLPRHGPGSGIEPELTEAGYVEQQDSKGTRVDSSWRY